MQIEITSQALLRFGGLIVGLALAEGIFRFLMRKTIIGVSRLVEYDLRNDFFAHLQKMPQRFYHRVKTGDLMARATNDLEAVRQVAGPAIMYSANTVVSMSAFAIIAYLNLKLTLIAMVPFPIMALIVQRLARRLNQAHLEIQTQYADITSKVQENLSGIRIVKAYCQEDGETQQFSGLNQAFIQMNLRMAKIRGLMTAAMTFLVGLGSLIILWFGGQQVILGHISLGSFVAFFAYLSMLTWPMIALGWVINLVQQGAASMGRMNRIFETEPGIRDNKRTDLSIHHLSGEIEFTDLSFAYNGLPVLRNINLRIGKGETVAIVGPTGSGKSTLINLIPRLFEATEGSLRIDGRDIREIPLAVLRKNIGYVPQDTFLFSDSLENNIAFGTPNATREYISEAAEIAQIRGDILEFPQKFETLLGERGINISGGQKQRTALARAVIRKPTILILDDSLSAVDTYTEEAILTGLRKVMQDRTSIIVSHRVSTVKDADLIVFMDEGRITERGTHADLLAQGGAYASLYEKQLLEEAIASF